MLELFGHLPADKMKLLKNVFSLCVLFFRDFYIKTHTKSSRWRSRAWLSLPVLPVVWSWHLQERLGCDTWLPKLLHRIWGYSVSCDSKRECVWTCLLWQISFKRKWKPLNEKFNWWQKGLFWASSINNTILSNHKPAFLRFFLRCTIWAV